MRNVIIFIEESTAIDRVGANLVPHLIDGDLLHVVMELPEMKLDAMPLIGDLKEIRYRKANAQIENWHKALDLNIKGVKPLIFHERVTSNKLAVKLDKLDELIVFGMPHQEKVIRPLFQPLSKQLKLDYIFANGQVK